MVGGVGGVKSMITIWCMGGVWIRRQVEGKKGRLGYGEMWKKERESRDKEIGRKKRGKVEMRRQVEERKRRLV